MANDITLQEGHPLDENLRPVKVGGKTSALEISDRAVKVHNLEVNGTTSGVSASDDTKLPLAGGTMTGDIAVADGFVLDGSGDMNLDAAGGDIALKTAGNTVVNFDVGSSPQLKINASPSNSSDYFTFAPDTNGSLNIATTDAAGSDADLTLDIDGDINLDSHTGVFTSKKAGTEFSVTGSSYAGMILGYRCIGEDATPVTYTLTTSMVTIHADATVRFIAPPSGKVEVTFQAHYYGGNGSTLTLGLSDNATYSAISGPSAQYEKITWDVSRFDDAIINHNWVVTGLTAGDTYNYWIGAKTSSTSGTPTIKYGGDSAGENVPLIIKVTALPAAVSDFAEYG